MGGEQPAAGESGSSGGDLGDPLDVDSSPSESGEQFADTTAGFSRVPHGTVYAAAMAAAAASAQELAGAAPYHALPAPEVSAAELAGLGLSEPLVLAWLHNDMPNTPEAPTVPPHWLPGPLDRWACEHLEQRCRRVRPGLQATVSLGQLQLPQELQLHALT